MIRSIAAVLGGFLAMAIVVMIGTMAAAAALIPGGLSTMRSGPSGAPVSSRYLAVNLTVSLLAAVLGGTLTARIAGSNPRLHTFVLAGFVLVMSVVSARQSSGNTGGQPSWYGGVIAVIGVGGVLLGGVLLGPK